MNLSPRSVVALALCGAALMAVAKLGAVLQGGSSAMLASTVQSLIDVSFLSLLIYGLSGRLDATQQAPSERGFWSSIVPILLYALGAGVTLYDGIEHVTRPRVIAGFPHDEVLLAVGVVLSSAVLWLTSRSPEEVRRETRPDPVHTAVTVQAASAAVGHVAAFAGVAASKRWDALASDGVAAVAIGLVLVSVAAVMAIEASRLLRNGQEASPRLEDPFLPGEPLVPARALETKSMPPSAPAPSTEQGPTQVASAPSATGKPQVIARQPGKGGRGRRRR